MFFNYYEASNVLHLKILCVNIMQIVPTEYRYLSKEVLPTNQFSVTEYYVPIRVTDRSWPGQCPNWRLEILYIAFGCFLLHL